MEKLFIYKLGDFPEEVFSLDIKCDTPFSSPIQEKAYEGIRGTHSIEFKIVGKAAKKLFRQLDRMGNGIPQKLYDENYRNLSLTKKIEFKSLLNWKFKLKGTGELKNQDYE